ncbi:MAG: ribonuclease Y [Candidatus Colwellbacteria bacterium CG_4_9_14_0_2_um_filter_50_12]|uniref:Ribonuclease Y n=1 Tax=Candidatus Colwellbacteria bacterium CG_4_9_14_0_2_um_filter_50_12 TaxID=1974538 RepID=A0A2M8G1B0_9BACT|nr:MAG: ribonuclease Y [Candidatus Colwellbacteria bacterium CG_4_9_14_0_2_um_filter_50_12]
MNYEPFTVVGLVVLGLAIGYAVRELWGARRVNSLERKLKERSLKAENEAQDIVLQAKKKAVNLLEEAQREEKERKAALERTEERLAKREEEISTERGRINLASKEIEIKSAEVEKGQAALEAELSKIAGLSPEGARKRLFEEVEESHKNELSQLTQKLIREGREDVEKKSLEIITGAIQRYSRSHVSELTTSSFNLPAEDLKGKIIGREGRNIRTLERLTGVELIVDETPETIIISSFDPLRREIAKLALEKLVKDGRIQPAKIEEKVDEAKAEIEKRMYEIGEQAAYEVGVFDLPKEIVHLLGRLNFRTSFGQNVLTHSIEMAHISGMIASELGANVEVARRAALLHDIGKTIDHEVQGTHVELGRKILKKYGISEEIIKAMQSHHEEYPFETPEAFIVGAADVLSAARPGARRGTLENYIKRLGDLEKIATSFPGVKNAYAIAAGRELRVFVVPEQIDDFRALQLARDIAARIESDLKYPGEIKVNVIREMRAVEYAR